MNSVIDSYPTIPEFFSGRDIFITGGSGFMGKVFIEKLLRSCSSINRIYLLIRDKKVKTSVERLEILKESSVFDRIKSENNSHLLDKLTAISGDVTLIDLGITDNDFRLLKNVSIVVHCAASVRFDDSLTKSIILNTRGTLEVIKLCEKLKTVKVLAHVSTTYCNPDYRVVEEKIYPPYADWKEAIKIAETVDERLLNILTSKFMNKQPNTYTFTKSLSEQICNDYRDRLPILIYRPSIVISSMREPVPGWLDNFNGPVGLLIASGLGLLRTTYSNPDNILDYSPVDVSIKGLITAVWKHGCENEYKSIEQRKEDNSITVYNCATSNIRHVTIGELIEMGKQIAPEYPLDKLMWVPGGNVTNIRAVNYFRVIFYHILPAMVLDRIFILAGHKPFLVKLQRKIYIANCALEYFILNTWVFNNNNFLNLAIDIKKEDHETFKYDFFINSNLFDYFRDCTLGVRRYLLNEKDEDIPKAKRYYRRIQLLDRFIKFIFYGSILYYIISLIN